MNSRNNEASGSGMKKLNWFGIVLIVTLYTQSLSGTTIYNTTPGNRDSVDKQLLFNGRIWRNLYQKVRGDQFLFSAEFLPGTVTINGKTFPGCSLKYDICNDELLTRAGQNIIIQLNKELVSTFTIDYNGKTWSFQNITSDTVNGPGGYACFLYNGKNPLFIKYQKLVTLLAIDNKYDAFEQIQKLWLEMDGMFYPVSGTRDITALFIKNKQQINNFIKSQKLKVSRKRPESFIPLVEFCDKIEN
jgi:hypothetical protein